jgi:hypothetical protein
MPKPKSQETKVDPVSSDSSEMHHPAVPPQTPAKRSLRPGAKGQAEPRARKRIVARQRGPR